MKCLYQSNVCYFIWSSCQPLFASFYRWKKQSWRVISPRERPQGRWCWKQPATRLWTATLLGWERCPLCTCAWSPTCAHSRVLLSRLSRGVQEEGTEGSLTPCGVQMSDAGPIFSLVEGSTFQEQVRSAALCSRSLVGLELKLRSSRFQKPPLKPPVRGLPRQINKLVRLTDPLCSVPVCFYMRQGDWTGNWASPRWEEPQPLFCQGDLHRPWPRPGSSSFPDGGRYRPFHRELLSLPPRWPCSLTLSTQTCQHTAPAPCVHQEEDGTRAFFVSNHQLLLLPPSCPALPTSAYLALSVLCPQGLLQEYPLAFGPRPYCKERLGRKVVGWAGADLQKAFPESSIWTTKWLPTWHICTC